MIDKLEIFFQPWLPVELLYNRARIFGFTTSRKKFDGRWGLQINQFEKRTGLTTIGYPPRYCDRLITRPSAYSSYLSYYEDHENFLGTKILSDFKISRLDLAVDYPEHFASLVAGLNFYWKRLSQAYITKNSKPSGLEVGKSPERFVVYDKSLEQNETEPRTRIEVQLTGSKLPVKNFYHLPRLVEPEFCKRIFRNVFLHRIRFVELSALNDDIHKYRLGQLRGLVENMGFFVARRRLGEHRNFSRNYKNLFQLLDGPEHPSVKLFRNLNKFFNPQEEESSNEIRTTNQD